MNLHGVTRRMAGFVARWCGVASLHHERGAARPPRQPRSRGLFPECSRDETPIALLARAGHRSISTTNQYLHLAGLVFRDEAAARSSGDYSGYTMQMA